MSSDAASGSIGKRRARGEGLSDPDFNRLRALIYQECGIVLNPEKKTMVEIRVKRRLQSLGITSYDAYCDQVLSSAGARDELVYLIDVITTNKTDFFREPSHFTYLVSHVLPELAVSRGNDRSSLVWSAGCSTGEEPYTLGMVLSEYARANPNYRFKVLATDISTKVLQAAALGVFRSEVAKPVPDHLLRRYFMRSRDPESERVRIVPELRALVEFRRLNFMDADFGLEESPEIIFCRNVIIYFDRPTQLRVLQRLTHYLVPGGYFFAGHSESLQGMDLPLVPVGPAIYRKPR